MKNLKEGDKVRYINETGSSEFTIGGVYEVLAIAALAGLMQADNSLSYCVDRAYEVADLMIKKRVK